MTSLYVGHLHGVVHPLDGGRLKGNSLTRINPYFFFFFFYVTTLIVEKKQNWPQDLSS